MTAFNPSTRFPYPYTNIPPESILHTSDQIVFYVHRERLQSKSSTAFGDLFTDNDAVRLVGSLIVFVVAEDAIVINCLLLVLYVRHQLHPSVFRIRIFFFVFVFLHLRKSHCASSAPIFQRSERLLVPSRSMDAVYPNALLQIPRSLSILSRTRQIRILTRWRFTL